MIGQSTRWFLVGLLWLAVLSACAPQDEERPATDTESSETPQCGMEEIIKACQDAKRPTTEIESITASWCASMEETIEETLTACQQGRVAEAEEEAEKIREGYLVHIVDKVCDDAKRPAVSTEPMMAFWCVGMKQNMAAMKQGRYAEVKKEAVKTTERFLVHLKDNSYDAAKELSVGSALSYLDGTDKSMTDPAWDSAWRKIHNGISSWKMDGWGTKIGNLYNGYSAQKAVEERMKPVLRAREETFVFLAYTLKHPVESDTALDFIILPTEQGWRISEISIVRY